MPFQVSYSQKAIPAGIIQGISAGNDFATVCDTDVTITAFVVGDLQGHTVEWIQVSGSPVTFTTPLNQLEVSYSQTSFDDKVFRFFIDRGTGFEKFDDVSIFGSPVEQIVFNIVATQSQYSSASNTVGGDAPKIKFLTPFPTQMHAGEHVVENYTSGTIAWSTPVSDAKILNYIVKERDNTTGLQNDIAILAPDANYYRGITVGNTYQIIAIYRMNNSKIVQLASNTLWLNGIIDSRKTVVGVNAIDAISGTLAFTNSSNISDYLVEKLSILKHIPPPDNINLGIKPTSTARTFDYDVDKFTIIQHSIPDNDTFVVGVGAATLNTQTIFDYDVTVQTGGQVGG